MAIQKVSEELMEVSGPQPAQAATRPAVPNFGPVITAIKIGLAALNARVLLLLSLLGGFWLAQEVLSSPDTLKLYALTIYLVFVFLPTIWFSVLKG